jgi:uncharacterized protein YceK
MKAALIALALLLAGCATGVKMTDEEAAACKEQGCTVWTDAELQGLALEAMRQGYIRGAQSRGKPL